MKINKQDIKCLVAFIITLAITRHIVRLTSQKLLGKDKRTIMELIKSTNYQNIISSGDIIAAFVFCYLIRKCCGGHIMKAGLITFMLFYFMTLFMFATIADLSNDGSYTFLLAKDTQNLAIMSALSPAIAAMIVCKIC
jgi:hypothetical protein